MEFAVEALKWLPDGLIPAIVQDATSGQVLMLAYMSQESLARTLETGETWFYSRSRRRLWHKGEQSGHLQLVEAVWTDCDQDALLIKVRQQGPGACHEGFLSCFHHSLRGGPGGSTSATGASVGQAPERTFDPDTVYGDRASRATGPDQR
jgi:phosphoribosyl-ATP pyrophosphohydrolase/phosphoribosyl-AMP cyclohydrolase